MGGKAKRKTNSPLMRDGGKTPRTEDGDREDTCSQDDGGDVIADLKAFIRNENARNGKTLAEEIRKYNEERMTALESSLSFALTTNETLAKRLSEVEQRAHKTENDLIFCARRLTAAEEQLDEMRQKEYHDWLVFSGPAIARAANAGRGQEVAKRIHELIYNYMGYNMDMSQVKEVRRDERQIQIRFNAVSEGSDRFFLVRNKTKLRGSGLFIRERLTPSRQRIFNETLQLKRNRQLNTVFTRDGTVFVVVDQRDRPRPVRSEAAVERLVRYLSERAAEQHQTEPPVRLTQHQQQTGETGATSMTAQSRRPAPEQLGGAGAPGQTDSVPGSVEWRRTESPRAESPRDGGSDAEREQHQPMDHSEEPREESAEVDQHHGSPASARLTSLGADGADSGGRRADGGGGAGAEAESTVRRPESESTVQRPVRQRRTGTAQITGPRHRFGGDIRSFVRGPHTKSD